VQYDSDSKPFDPSSRYWKPWDLNTSSGLEAAKAFKFYLVPISKGSSSQIETTMKALERAVSKITEDPDINIVGIPAQNIIPVPKFPPGSEVISVDFFSYWTLFVSREGGKPKSLFQTAPWEHAFPPVEKIKKFHDERLARGDFVNSFKYKTASRQSTITYNKVQYASGKLRETSQQAVMNNTSATLVSL
jgi:hypothetical protein